MYKDYRFSFEVIAQAQFLSLKISSIPVRCDYKSDHHSMPLTRAIPCIIHTIKTGIMYRLAKLGIRYAIFKKI